MKGRRREKKGKWGEEGEKKGKRRGEEGEWVRADDRSIINSGVQDYQTGRMQATMLVI